MAVPQEIAMLPRDIALKVLVGSHNYLLNDESSDRDYKLFVMPTFDDLYNNDFYSMPNIITDEADYDVHDIRRLPRLLWGSNVNYLEVLFSVDISMPWDNGVPDELKELLSMKQRIAHMNIPKLYDSCVGGYYQRMALLHKGTASTKCLID